MKNESIPAPASRSPGWGRAARNLAAQLTEPRGSYEVYLPTPDLCITRARGHFSVHQARLLTEALVPAFAEGRSVAVFHDWHEMTTYDSGARRLLTNWVLANIRTLRSIDLLVGSRIVAMGVAAANVATSLAGLPLVAYTSRADFDEKVLRSV